MSPTPPRRKQASRRAAAPTARARGSGATGAAGRRRGRPRQAPPVLTVHYDDAAAFGQPHLVVWYAGTDHAHVLPPAATDAFGAVFRLTPARREFRFRFKEGPGLEGRWEPEGLTREFRPLRDVSGGGAVTEIWCKGDRAFLYPVGPRRPEAEAAAEVIRALPLKRGAYVPDTGGLSGLGAHVLADGRVLFGLYHPNAARVYVMGSFNDWQRPGHEAPDPSRFLEMSLHRGWFGEPNTWLLVTDQAQPGDEYKFLAIGGVPRDAKNRLQQYLTDPYARRLGPDMGWNNSVIVDPTTYRWHDAGWRTPEVSQAILYELSVHGFTEGDGDVAAEHHGRFRGITERIRAGYFGELGVTALSLMPLAEVPSPQGPTSLGYDPSLYLSVERDFGAPDDLREMVDAAHRQGLAVLLDQVFNHTSSGFNPMWKAILEHPAEEADPSEGGLYFSGSTDWGNRIATEKEDVQNLLIDACKHALVEYHVDGFRLDATHSRWMHHGFLHRLYDALKRVKPDVWLVAENLPNERDLHRDGWDGFAQWCDPFHDTVKALLREGPFGDTPDRPEGIADVFYFCKSRFAAHTNNVINYSESHDETSIPYEVGTNPLLAHPAARERKGRLGLFAALVALGQPMLYMGQEFNVERDRNQVSFAWPSPVAASGFWQWVRRLIHLRRRYPGLRMAGFDPAADGRFAWTLGPWMDARHGAGRRVIGWHARPTPHAFDALVVMLNFEAYPVEVDVELGLPGVWVKLADMDGVNDIPPAGTSSARDPSALVSLDGRFAGFVLPSSSGFVYKWEAPA